MKQKIENLLLNLVHVRTEMCWLLLNNIIETCDRVLVTTLFRIRIPHAEENNIDGRYPSVYHGVERILYQYEGGPLKGGNLGLELL